MNVLSDELLIFLHFLMGNICPFVFSCVVVVQTLVIHRMQCFIHSHEKPCSYDSNNPCQNQKKKSFKISLPNLNCPLITLRCDWLKVSLLSPLAFLCLWITEPGFSFLCPTKPFWVYFCTFHIFRMLFANKWPFHTCTNSLLSHILHWGVYFDKFSFHLIFSPFFSHYLHTSITLDNCAK